jgi:hypothetical protein
MLTALLSLLLETLAVPCAALGELRGCSGFVTGLTLWDGKTKLVKNS